MIIPGGSGSGLTAACGVPRQDRHLVEPRISLYRRCRVGSGAGRSPRRAPPYGTSAGGMRRAGRLKPSRRRAAGMPLSAGPGGRARRSSCASRVGRRPGAAGRSGGTGGRACSSAALRWMSVCGSGHGPAPSGSAGCDQVLACGGVMENPASSSKTSQAPRAQHAGHRSPTTAEASDGPDVSGECVEFGAVGADSPEPELFGLGEGFRASEDPLRRPCGQAY